MRHATLSSVQKQKSIQDTLYYMAHRRVHKAYQFIFCVKNKEYTRHTKAHSTQEVARGLPVYLLCEEQGVHRTQSQGTQGIRPRRATGQGDQNRKIQFKGVYEV